MRRSPPIAKLARPRLHGAVARDRLFARLDGTKEGRAAICIVGPPGAGKTTLAASWLNARKLQGVWYQVDSGDADLATFFHRLVPENAGYRHQDEGPDDMPAHIKAALTQTQIAIPVDEGKPVLGTWQGIYLFEHRAAPHKRDVVLLLIGE